MNPIIVRHVLYLDHSPKKEGSTLLYVELEEEAYNMFRNFILDTYLTSWVGGNRGGGDQIIISQKIQIDSKNEMSVAFVYDI